MSLYITLALANKMMLRLLSSIRISKGFIGSLNSAIRIDTRRWISPHIS
jgi:hypothetical protein